MDVYVTSVESLGLWEPNFEGGYEERVKLDVTTTAYAAKWGDELFRDRATLTTRTVQKQGEQYYSERILGLNTRERGIYRLLVGWVRALLPRFPQRKR